MKRKTITALFILTVSIIILICAVIGKNKNEKQSINKNEVIDNSQDIIINTEPEIILTDKNIVESDASEIQAPESSPSDYYENVEITTSESKEYENYDIKIPEGKITLPEKFSQNIKTKENQTDESSLLTSEKTNKNEIDGKVNSVAKELGIEEILTKYPYEVSGGQKQRTACARALITNPKLILADEPTGALDSRSAQMLIEMISSLNKDFKATILMVTHDSFTASYCDRILFIKDGKIFTELVRGNNTRKQFFNQILDVVALLGGDVRDVR